MHHLAGSVDAGIGSSRGEGLDRAVWIQLLDRRLQLGLHTVAVAFDAATRKRRNPRTAG